MSRCFPNDQNEISARFTVYLKCRKIRIQIFSLVKYNLEYVTLLLTLVWCWHVFVTQCSLIFTFYVFCCHLQLYKLSKKMSLWIEQRSKYL